MAGLGVTSAVTLSNLANSGITVIYHVGTNAGDEGINGGRTLRGSEDDVNRNRVSVNLPTAVAGVVGGGGEGRNSPVLSDVTQPGTEVTVPVHRGTIVRAARLSDGFTASRNTSGVVGFRGAGSW